jgi:hypothetical protein
LFFSLFAILIILSTIKERYKSKKYCSLILVYVAFLFYLQGYMIKHLRLIFLIMKG